MNFHVPEMESSKAKWYLSLIELQDVIGSVQDLQRSVAVATATNKPLPSVAPAVRTIYTTDEALRIIEVIDSDEEDNDLTPYSKADTDPEDDEDDPMTARRDHPVAPV